MKYLLVLCSLFWMSCQSSHLTSKSINKIIHQRVSTAFNNYVQEVIDNRALHLTKSLGLDSVQQEQLRAPKQWKALITAQIDSVLEFTNNLVPSKEEKATLCQCLEKELANPICNQLITPINDEIGLHLDQLLSELEYAMTHKILNNHWIVDNTTPENCAPLQNGLYYYYTPVNHLRVEVERLEGKQLEELNGTIEKYKIIWTSYNSYQLEGIDFEEEYKAQVEVVHVQPTYYLFKTTTPYSPGDYVMGRLYRIIKKS